MSDYQAPGVYLEEVLALPEPAFLTGVPVFLGYAQQGTAGTPTQLSLWPQFAAIFGDPPPNSYLAYAVRGFFENGGLVCYVISLDQTLGSLSALRQGLASAETLDYVDLVGAPDLLR